MSVEQLLERRFHCKGMQVCAVRLTLQALLYRLLHFRFSDYDEGSAPFMSAVIHIHVKESHKTHAPLKEPTHSRCDNSCCMQASSLVLNRQVSLLWF